MEDVSEGALHALPHTDFDVANAEQAFRLMAQAGHIGKIVLAFNEPEYRVERAEAPLVRPEGTYLITGGLGGFGMAIADWLVRRGARNLVLMSRSGAPRDEDAARFQNLMQSEARIVVMHGDVTDAGDVERVIRAVRSGMPPLKGVIHAAMTLDDDLLGRLGLDRFHAVLAPKIAGGWNLHRLTGEDDLDFFVLFSSGSSMIGIPAQSNYAAANAFLDGLALHRRALGLPALAINWGAIEGVGYVARHPELQGRLRWEGVDSITTDEACAALEHALRHKVGRVAVARIDWDRWSDHAAQTPGATAQALAGGAGSDTGRTVDKGVLTGLRNAEPAERRALLEQHLVRHAARVLDTPAARVDPARSLTDMGMDSLMAVEFQTALGSELGVDVSLVELLGGMSLRKLVDGLLDQLSLDSVYA
jgi:acyl carrier protein